MDKYRTTASTVNTMSNSNKSILEQLIQKCALLEKKERTRSSRIAGSQHSFASMVSQQNTSGFGVKFGKTPVVPKKK